MSSLWHYHNHALASQTKCGIQIMQLLEFSSFASITGTMLIQKKQEKITFLCNNDVQLQKKCAILCHAFGFFSLFLTPFISKFLAGACFSQSAFKYRNKIINTKITSNTTGRRRHGLSTFKIYRNASKKKKDPLCCLYGFWLEFHTQNVKS